MSHSRRDCPGAACRFHRWPPGTGSPAQRHHARAGGRLRRPVDDVAASGRREPLNAMTMTRNELEAGLRAWGIPPTDAARIARDLRRWAVRRTVEDDERRSVFGDDDDLGCGGVL